eukprot:2901401-Pyramimonas_sp.AAC.1
MDPHTHAGNGRTRSQWRPTCWQWTHTLAMDPNTRNGPTHTLATDPHARSGPTMDPHARNGHTRSRQIHTLATDPHAHNRSTRSQWRPTLWQWTHTLAIDRSGWERGATRLP